MPCIRMRREARWVILACICEALGWQRFWDYACIRMRRKSRCVTHAYICAALGWQGLVFGATSHPKNNLILSTGLKMFVFERLSDSPFLFAPLCFFVFPFLLLVFVVKEGEWVERHQKRSRRRLFNNSMATNSFVTYFPENVQIRICFTATEGSPSGHFP